ncbi:hypothetical protein ABY45_14585 [Microbacterium maritypicum]|uniref:hypothetical protein n=1 Tax=Microbacterium maritypicum TaxID=33918 RepID=UPI003D6FCF60
MRTPWKKSVEGVEYTLIEEPGLEGVHRYWRAWDGSGRLLDWSEEDEAEYGD